MAKIEFVTYTGKYPNLCTGVFLVNIDGVLTAFYYNPNPEVVKDELANEGVKLVPEKYYSAFWSSGGRCWCSGSDEGVSKGDWEFDEYEYEDFGELKELLPELIRIFNENVEQGCCGGCI